jgi:hypothetical protein
VVPRDALAYPVPKVLAEVTEAVVPEQVVVLVVELLVEQEELLPYFQIHSVFHH